MWYFRPQSQACNWKFSFNRNHIVLQKIITTAPNRYPGVFLTVRSLINDERGPDLGGGRLRILSFGCSTGTEVLTLRAYFPDAMIFGCDVDSNALRSAIKNTREDSCRLFVSTPEAIAANGPYDIIFGMSVFCQYPASKQVQNLNSIYPFSLFDKLASNLVENLADEGIICMVNSNHLFRDLAVASDFNVVRSPLIAGNGFIDKFDSSGNRLTTSFGNKSCYSHQRVAGEIVDDDLIDCIFKKPRAGQNGKKLLLSDNFLRTKQPNNLQKIKSLPHHGECLDTAIVENRVAMMRSADVYVSAHEDDYWVKYEWMKSTLSGDKVSFGDWWVPVSHEGAGILTTGQAAQPAELIQYLDTKKSIGNKLRRFFGR